LAGFKSAANKTNQRRTENAREHRFGNRGFTSISSGTAKDLNNIREYFINNPMQWHVDEENPRRDV